MVWLPNMCNNDNILCSFVKYLFELFGTHEVSSLQTVKTQCWFKDFSKRTSIISRVNDPHTLRIIYL